MSSTRLLLCLLLLYCYSWKIWNGRQRSFYWREIYYQTHMSHINITEFILLRIIGKRKKLGHSPNGVVWMTRLLGALLCCCRALDALCRWSKLSVEPFLMDRTLAEPLLGTAGVLVHVSQLPRGAGDAVTGCRFTRLETTACCILCERSWCSGFSLAWIGWRGQRVRCWNGGSVCLYTGSGGDAKPRSRGMKNDVVGSRQQALCCSRTL